MSIGMSPSEEPAMFNTHIRYLYIYRLVTVDISREIEKDYRGWWLVFSSAYKKSIKLRLQSREVGEGKLICGYNGSDCSAW